MTGKTIDPQHACDLFADGCAEPGHTAGPWMFVGTQHVRTARWEEVYWMVVREQNTSDLYGVEYREGLTENQETEYPWEESEAPLSLVRLYSHEVTTFEYRKAAA
jgi:hypothetical protein